MVLAIHVALSLVGIVTGFMVVNGMRGSRRLPAITAVFLATTILTDVTGYMLPAEKILPSHIVGAISLVILGVAVFGLYVKRLAGAWRPLYVGTAVAGLYLNTFVLVAQAFLKVPALKEMAPTQQEPPFAIAQAVVFLAFVGIGFVVVKAFHPAEEREAAQA